MYVYCVRRDENTMVVCMATSTSRHTRSRSRSTGVSYSKSRFYRNRAVRGRQIIESSDVTKMGHSENTDEVATAEQNDVTSLEDRIKAIVLEKQTSKLAEDNANPDQNRGKIFSVSSAVTSAKSSYMTGNVVQPISTERTYSATRPSSSETTKSSEKHSIRRKSSTRDDVLRQQDTRHRSSRQQSSQYNGNHGDDSLSTFRLRSKSESNGAKHKPDHKSVQSNRHSVILGSNLSSDLSVAPPSVSLKREKTASAAAVVESFVSPSSNSNITDSEKIYHKLRGITKVTRHKSLYVPICNRTSIFTDSLSQNVEPCAKIATKYKPKKDHNRASSQSIPVSAKSTTNKVDKPAKVDQENCLEIRQCRIGSSLAFGIVQVTKKTEPNSNGYTEGQGLVTIKMKPDDQGRFGFNVKGGADQGMPIIVSRVAPGTPADLAIPRLNEGDQVLFINGRDVSQHTHEQAVMFIRASKETHSGGELSLVVRPNVYVGEDQNEEPAFDYLPETHQITTPGGANALEASLLLLQESLESGAALAQFEQLYRKKPGMTMNAARMEANLAKNRYRDISPYDQTRVILKDPTGNSVDYINANYVNMEIPGSGIVNRYIAAQGPLPKTCTDFWQMVWEQHSSLVVMLTTKVERGRVKCHQYWPDLYETMDYGVLQITCVKEEETNSFAFREFNLTQVETHEERHISHMQYIAWPDHGVPDDPADFLDFVLKVRQRRTGMVEPTVVHCSAGIGRTGVLITMETAMCLIEANQPVYPLSIVRQMRDQRAMLIQTASQYKFVCEAILRVYNEGLVKPLEDYQR